MKALNPLNVWNFFVAEETRSSALLVLASLLGITLANSSLSSFYFQILSYDITFGFVSMDVKHWINEGLMALFFLVVSLEIKRELIDGELRGWSRASFPVFGAIGGMLLPALIFTAFNPELPESRGWAIAMATDIAIAIGVLGLLGNRVPRSLRVFLLTLAIVDDIGSIVVIGFFYSQPTNALPFLLAILALLTLSILRKSRYWMMLFCVLGLVLWYFLLLSGVPGTIAGVAIAFLAPLSTRRKGTKKLQLAEIAEDILLPLTSFIIVPLFVFANTGIPLNSLNITDPVASRVFVGIFLGLALGKPAGIFIGTRFAAWLKLTKKPNSMSWLQVVGVGCIAGIGFTVSLLISGLAYNDNALLFNASVIAIFCASLFSAIVGLKVLTLRK